MKRTIGYREFSAALFLVVVVAVLALPAMKKAAHSNARNVCANNLKQIGLVLKMYANESPGEKYPPVSRVRNNWIIDVHSIYPKYINDLSILIDPASPFAYENTFRSRPSGELDPDCVSGLFYNYTGYLLTGDAQAVALLSTYESMDTLEFRSLDHSLNIPVWKKSFGNSGLAVMWDRVPLVDSELSHHAPKGGNVLILDGHVEFVEYSPYNNSSFFPMNRVGAETFGSVQPKLPRHCF